MNDKRDMAPMVWGYIKSRETARRMDAYAGEVQAMHPFYSFDSPARANDMDLATTNAVRTYLICIYVIDIANNNLVRAPGQSHSRYPARLMVHACQARESTRTVLPQLQLSTRLGRP